MIIVSVQSRRIDWINNLNEANKVPFIGALIIACIFMLPVLVFQEIVQFIFEKNQIFELSSVFFFNVFCFHLFLKVAFDITIKFFFIPSLVWAIFLSIFHFFNEKELLIELMRL